MVVGLDKFKTYFAAHGDHYVLIGGAACDLLFANARLPFRTTKDLDIVICVEVLSGEFARAFAAFLEEGKYAQRAMYEGQEKFFRFAKPEAKDYPAMIELFAQPSAAIGLPDTDRYIRLKIEDAQLSLSALLLHADYYALIKEGREAIDGVSILSKKLLIPFKARAWLDLMARKQQGESIDGNNIKKHRNDIFRLVQLLTRKTVSLPSTVKTDLKRFVDAMADEQVDPARFKVQNMTKDEALSTLMSVYGL
jgi:hypothetical protein